MATTTSEQLPLNGLTVPLSKTSSINVPAEMITSHLLVVAQESEELIFFEEGLIDQLTLNGIEFFEYGWSEKDTKVFISDLETDNREENKAKILFLSEQLDIQTLIRLRNALESSKGKGGFACVIVDSPIYKKTGEWQKLFDVFGGVLCLVPEEKDAACFLKEKRIDTSEDCFLVNRLSDTIEFPFTADNPDYWAKHLSEFAQNKRFTPEILIIWTVIVTGLAVLVNICETYIWHESIFEILKHLISI